MQTLLTIKKVAQRLATSTRTVSRYERAGRIKAIRLSSRTVRFDEADVERFIAEGGSK